MKKSYMFNSNLKFLTCIFIFFLASCNVSTSTTKTDSTNETSSSSTAMSGSITKRSSSDSEEVTCVKSTLDKCHFLYFTESCEIAKPDAKTSVKTCTTKITEEFSLVESETKKINKLSIGIKECVSYKSPPDFPSCYIAKQ